MDALDERLIRVSGEGVRREHGELRPGDSGPVKADYRVVEKWMTPREAFRAACATCVQHLEANRQGALAGTDPEYLHQMRVALRRLRTAFAVFGDAVPEPAASGLLADLRWLSRAMGDARNWDVFVAGTLRSVLSQRPRHAGLRALRAECQELRAEARLAACRALESRRYFGIMRTLRALSYDTKDYDADYGQESPRSGRMRPMPMQRHAATVITAMCAKARKRGRKLMRLGAKDLHRLRIAVRQLRYGLLFLAPLLPEARSRALAGAVEALQETLGGINDCAIADELIEAARAGARGPQRRKARKLLARSVKTAQAARRGQLKAQWEDFRVAGRGWAWKDPG